MCVTKVERKVVFFKSINIFFQEKKKKKAVAVMLSAGVSEEMEVDALVIRRV